MSYLLLDISDGVALLTINRPRSLNALNGEVLTELSYTLAGLARDQDVKVIVLTGAGSKAFVAGADIAEMATMDPAAALEFARRGQRVMLGLEKMPKPVLAAVNGYALGGGLELALACDCIYAADSAMFGLPEVTLGIMPGFGGTQNLARLVGRGRASEMIFSGKMVTASKALAWGVVNEVWPSGELVDRVLDLARHMARNAPCGVAAAKDALVNGLNMAKEDGLRYESALFTTLFASKDQEEGMQAFLAKRKPVFQGR
jgi:enoyl-CoA hydratase